MAKEMTIEKLARMVKEGFDDTATKADLRSLATKEELRTGFQALSSLLDFLRQEVREIKEVNRLVLGPLARTVAENKESLQGLERRVMRIERKVGLAK